MGRIHLTDRQWAFIRPLLPPPARTERPRADDRRTIEGIICVLITGSRWHDLPREYGAPDGLAAAQALGRGRRVGARLAGRGYDKSTFRHSLHGRGVRMVWGMEKDL